MLINVVTIPISTLLAIVASEMVYVNFHPTNVARVSSALGLITGAVFNLDYQ